MKLELTTTKWLVALIGLCLNFSLSGCQNPEETKQTGGVDGSGGNLSDFTEASFDDWIKNDHPYY